MEDLRNEDKIFPLDGQSERTIQMLEDMLWECAIDFQGSWSNFPMVEFAYNNNYQATISMAPYEAPYGRKCRSPISLGWDRRAKVSWSRLNYCLIGSDRENTSKNVGSSKSTEKLCR